MEKTESKFISIILTELDTMRYIVQYIPDHVDMPANKLREILTKLNSIESSLLFSIGSVITSSEYDTFLENLNKEKKNAIVRNEKYIAKIMLDQNCDYIDVYSFFDDIQKKYGIEL